MRCSLFVRFLDTRQEGRVGFPTPQRRPILECGLVAVYGQNALMGINVRRDTDEFKQRRWRMVENQLRPRGIRQPRVIQAMLEVPREEFVPEELRNHAYDDCAEPIGDGQTISQPFTVAFMAEQADLHGDEKVLEVGTGSGYGAAILSRLAAEVHTIERLPAFAHRAAATLHRLGITNVSVHIGDGSLGFAEQAPYDAIIVTAGAAYLPPAYAAQLVEGGRIVIPIGGFENRQHLYCFRRHRDTLVKEDLGAFAFVPLIGDDAWQREP